MSLVSFIGPRPNILDHAGNSKRKRLEVRQPILTNEDLEKIRSIGSFEDSFDTKTLDITYASRGGAEGMAAALDRLCGRADQAVQGGYNIIILSDRLMGADRIPIPALLATAAVHHHLIRNGLRTSVGPRGGDGRGARGASLRVCLPATGQRPSIPTSPSRRWPTWPKTFPETLSVSPAEAVKRYIKSIGKGLLKVMSKMGISTYQSYCGAQIFDAIGLAETFVGQYFTGTASRIGGVGHRGDRAGKRYPPSRCLRRLACLSLRARCRRQLPVSPPRRSPFLQSPQSVSLLQHARPRPGQGCSGALPRVRSPAERSGRQPPDDPRPVSHQDGRGGGA